MRVLVFRSLRGQEEAPEPEYSQEFDTAYADRVLGNLRGADDFCTACGPDCIFCRRPYERRFAENIAGVIAFPSVLPYVLEHPEEYVPGEVPAHDVLLAIHIHEQILLESLRRCRDWGTKGVVAPIESQDWVSPATRSEARRICERDGIEIAFPKPFCSFRPPGGGVLARFREFFHIGYPEVELTVERGKIAAAGVRVSAPCGATYYVARWLVGKRVEDDLKYDVVSKRLHSYPCTSSMAWDDDLGDTILHVAGQAHYKILSPLEQSTDEGPEMVLSPVRRLTQKPVPPSENLRKIEQAEEAVLAAIENRGHVSLQALRKNRKLTPAALNTAVLLLRQSGRIRVEGGEIRSG